MTIKDKVFIITGGGSGMGRQLAIGLVRKGARAAIADINETGMAETAELAGTSKVSVHPLNISDRVAVEAFAAEVIARYGKVDGLINNAGIIQPFIDVKDLDYPRIERIMNINFYGTLYMTKAFLPHLLERPEAYLMNISSMGGFFPFPGQTFYGASKAAVKLLTEGLYAELRRTNVHVTLVYPGAVNTNIMANSGVAPAGAPAGGKAYRALAADKAAAIMIDAIERNKYRVLVGSDARFMDFLYRLSPRRAINYITGKMGR